MRLVLYLLLARLLLICSVCLLTIAQTTSAFSSITPLRCMRLRIARRDSRDTPSKKWAAGRSRMVASR